MKQVHGGVGVLPRSQIRVLGVTSHPPSQQSHTICSEFGKGKMRGNPINRPLKKEKKKKALSGYAAGA